MDNETISIDHLITVVKKGGRVKTGVDIYNKSGVLLLEQDIMVSSATVLENIKKNGVNTLAIIPGNQGGLWDETGKPIVIETHPRAQGTSVPTLDAGPEIEIKLREITHLRKEATANYQKARGNISKVLGDIKKTGGQFDYTLVEDTVSDLLKFMTENENGFSYLTKEIFSYDNYLHNHSVNVCTIGTAIISRFNKRFSESVNEFLASGVNVDASFRYYQPEELVDISAGYFLHDIGKVLVPDNILNKKGRLTQDEFDVVRRHSYEKGLEILEKNKINNRFIRNIIMYHHSVLYDNEMNCYPDEKAPEGLPAYVKVCKLADIYDAMTSKRSYKDAFNPINVVTEIFRKYARKDNLLQFILYSFVKSIGIYPTGSVVMLENGQYAYILDSIGPLVLPFTDTEGKTLDQRQAALDLGGEGAIKVDSERSLLHPMESFEILPPYLKALSMPA
ncbi:MAG: HD domain-containing protein [Proteobacteria bacterium]|nr:HD domain-containing protein [Pseudomonadota bacterium]